VINSVAQMVRNSVAFDPQQERDFLLAMARAYFFLETTFKRISNSCGKTFLPSARLTRFQRRPAITPMI
jgi:hypothetical protein